MSLDLGFWTLQALNALQLSMLLFLLSIGLTVIFGLMHFVNLAHGALYALGAYFAASVAAVGGYWAGFFLAPVAVAGVGVLLYSGLIQRMRKSGPMAQVLVTFGLIFALLDITRIVWGDLALGLEVPELLAGRVALLGVEYPAYRLFIIALGLAIFGALAFVLSRTQIGAMIRAGVDNDAMAACLGINVERLFFIVFCVGCALAGLAGAVAAPLLSVTPDMGLQILIPTLIVIVIGGLGSLKGAIAGSLIFGFVQTFGAVLAPQLASVLIYALLAAVLVIRPVGLFPAKG
ncbi:High-affinity branched-chain amino acid transport system permease protein LivH [Roseovarius sp. EC-HK134]|jgi:branched-chain amino acid transport system permease protein|uniref:High-affinity branched-chain amino acid transport system permease protein LivH n=1 Tax=Roseovarius mucosus TaxID=215743 RepID=A0A1V0RTU7_9RHOB|nr:MULTISPECIES: branched-chain amino acid ABC transporter permease [Roseovarius]ARE85184.1 high-affinity branched-chain amino acid transport system permease protein LivH [Roseovarius mucosus]AWZ21281.1 Benzoate transport, inner-membrane translocator [Roseovarius sp. AK1035]EDM30772.1 inner-membrane translocator [Roseovarius sp. TM1035]MBW4974286.1 branched-chain amino acid ABC transporter permease [Roseovarius mucosus]VVT24696.1 High-affinity branched-chain amino acid transport system permeas|tara:strand:- start:403 stop:1272 length:870 start_codon:yes stop_codon:yes gene_type:complete